MTKVIAIACIEKETRAIGTKDGSLLFHIPQDMKHFRSVTTDHPVIMGRNTFDSFKRGALVDRTNIVITRNKKFSAPNTVPVGNIEKALAVGKKEDDEKVFVIGGGEIYTKLLPYTDELWLTEVTAKFFTEDGNLVYFPKFEDQFKQTFMGSLPLQDAPPSVKYAYFTRHTRK